MVNEVIKIRGDGEGTSPVPRQFFDDLDNVSRSDITHVKLSEALTGTFDSRREESTKTSVYEHVEVATNILSLVTSNLVEPTVSAIASIEHDIEKASIEADTDGAEPFQMEVAADVIWTSVFGLMIGGAIIGNLVVVWIVLGNNHITFMIMTINIVYYCN